MCPPAACANSHMLLCTSSQRGHTPSFSDAPCSCGSGSQAPAGRFSMQMCILMSNRVSRRWAYFCLSSVEMVLVLSPYGIFFHSEPNSIHAYLRENSSSAFWNTSTACSACRAHMWTCMFVCVNRAVIVIVFQQVCLDVLNHSEHSLDKSRRTQSRFA